LASITQPQTGASAIPGIGLSWRQYAGLSGIIGVILFVIGVLMIGDAPTIDDSVADVRSFYVDNQSKVLWGNFAIGIGVIMFLLPFTVGLRQRLAEAEGNGGPWAMLAFIAVLFWLLLGGAASSASGALALGIDKIEGDGPVRVLQYLDFAGFSSNGLVLTPFFLALGFVIMQTKVFWGWLAYLSLVLAVVSFISCFAFVSGDPDSIFMLLGYISTLGFGVTTLLVGFAMFREPAEA
jgi:hypothetical protein